jgi:hypothetical protein
MVNTAFDSPQLTAADPRSLGARLSARINRLRRAWRYTRGTLSTNDAREILLECRTPAGWHPLDILMTDDVADDINQLYISHPQLPRLISKVCERLGREWKPSTKSDGARRDAIALIEDLARFEGHFLLRRPIEDVPESIRAFAPKNRGPALLPPPSRDPALTTQIKAILPPPAEPSFKEFDHEAALTEGWILKRNPARSGTPYITIEPTRHAAGRRSLSPADLCDLGACCQLRQGRISSPHCRHRACRRGGKTSYRSDLQRRRAPNQTTTAATAARPAQRAGRTGRFARPLRSRRMPAIARKSAMAAPPLHRPPARGGEGILS